MLAAVVKFFQVFSNFLIVWRDWGLQPAFSFIVTSKSAAAERVTRLEPLNADFAYRGVLDRPVLAQFHRGFGFIDTRNGAPISSIVDAGGNIGVFSVFARRIYPAAKIIAIEAEPDNFRILEKNAAALGNVVSLQAGLWKEAGTIYLNFGPNPESHSVSTDKGDGAQPVVAVSIPELMQRYSFERIDLLKMDIEGAESVVIQSLGEELLKRVNCIRFECNDTDSAGNALKVLACLSPGEFDAFAFDENVYLIRRSTGWTFKRHYPGQGEIVSL